MLVSALRNSTLYVFLLICVIGVICGSNLQADRLLKVTSDRHPKTRWGCTRCGSYSSATCEVRKGTCRLRPHDHIQRISSVILPV